MKFFVTVRAFDTITKPDDVQRTRKGVGVVLERILHSGKLSAGGTYADGRGGFFVLDAATPLELTELLGEEVFDTCTVVTHPVLPHVALITANLAMIKNQMKS